uniref:RRM domain-containing protein n=1 Tax=Plectus sambesii TaxID=2011161 RepID=A0A914X903_9BILA
MGGYVPIDQSDIPESRHAIFIRGFPANMLTDRIRDFFNDQVGRCAFDFVKQSPDGSKLFVALRFDEKDAARDCMERFNETNVLGHRVSFQWYRDVRRYVSYHQKRGSLPPPPPIRSRGGRFMPYRGRGSFPHSYGDSNFSRGRGFYNRGRPPLLQHRHDSYNRPRMRSPRHRSRTRSRSPAPSDLSTPRTRSVDRTPQSQRGGRDSPEHRSPSPEVAKKAKKQKKHKKKARNNSESPEDVSDSDIRSPNSKRRRESSEDREDREDREERDTPSPRSSPPPPHASQLMKNANEDTLESRRRQLMEKTGSTGMQLSSKVVAVGDQSQSLQSKALSIRMTLLPDSPEDASFSSSAAPTVLTEPIRSAERQVVLLPPGRSPDTNLQLSSVVISKENRNTKILNPIQLFLA